MRALEELSLEGPVPVTGASTQAGAERIAAELAPTGVPVVVLKHGMGGKGVGGLISWLALQPDTHIIDVLQHWTVDTL